MGTMSMPIPTSFSTLSYFAINAFKFKLVVQIAQDGDAIDNGSITWPDDRPQIEFGTIKVSSLMADNDAAQRRLIFDPTHLADGIELSDDALPAARSAIYSISYARRNP